MPTEAQILTLSQWFSPGYPVGAFAYSHGLEGAVDMGYVKSAGDLENWLTDILLHGAGWADALLLAASFLADTADETTQIDMTARAFAASKERLAETTRQGAAFCDVTAELWGAEISKLTYPVAVGRAAKAEALPLTLTAQMYLQAFMANLVAAGQRLLPVGQREAQRIIRNLTPLCGEIAANSQTGDLSHLSSTAFLADIASMRHETQYSRIFRT